MSDFQEQTGLTASALNALLVPITDVSGYKWWSLHIITINLVGVLNWKGSNFVLTPTDINWSALSGFNASSTGNVFTNYTNPGSASQIYSGPIMFRYFEVLMSAYTSGSATAVLELYKIPPFNAAIQANQSGVFTVQPGNTQNTTPWLVQPTGLATAVQQNKNGTATAGTATATLANVAGKFTYITGMEVTIIDTATAGSAELTLSGLAGGSVLYEINAQGVAGTGEPWAVNFGYPGLQASAVSTDIVATMPTLGAGTGKVSIVLHGYTQ